MRLKDVGVDFYMTNLLQIKQKSEKSKVDPSESNNR